MTERSKVSFLVMSSDDDRLLRLGLWVLSAASVGEAVDVLLTSRPLREWVKGSFGADGAQARAAGQVEGLAPPRTLLRQAQELAPVRILTCDTEWHLAGLTEEAVVEAVDEIVSLPTFWRDASGSRLVTI